MRGSNGSLLTIRSFPQQGHNRGSIPLRRVVEYDGLNEVNPSAQWFYWVRFASPNLQNLHYLLKCRGKLRHHILFLKTLPWSIIYHVHNLIKNKDLTPITLLLQPCQVSIIKVTIDLPSLVRSSI